MPANTGDNVILDLGMRVDSTGAQADIQDVVDYIRDTIKEDFNIDIRAGNLNDLRQQLNALGGDLRLVKDDATGMTTAIQASFKTANGEAVRLRAAVEAVNGAYQLVDGTDISARVTAGAPYSTTSTPRASSVGWQCDRNKFYKFTNTTNTVFDSTKTTSAYYYAKGRRCCRIRR